jgi:hypothetical protein
MGTATFDLLGTTTLSSTTTEISLTGIPSGYKHMRLTISAGFTTQSRSDFNMKVNNTSSYGYRVGKLFSEVSAVYFFNSISNHFILAQPNGQFAATIDFLNADGSGGTTTIQSTVVEYNEGMRMVAGSGISGSAISSLQFFTDDNRPFDVGSTVSIWGLVG